MTLLGQALQMAVQMTGIVVLARLLEPEDFGLIVMAGTVLAIVEPLKDLGLPTATVQAKEISNAEVSNLFWMNLLFGAGLCLSLVGIAPAVAWFYEDSRLRELLAVMGIGLVFSGVAAQHRALLLRDLRFRALASIDLTAQVLGTGVAITAALLGAGFWSLAIRALCTQFILSIGAWAACPWRPQRFHRGTSVKSLVRFGGHLTGFSAFNYVARNIDDILIGKFLGGVVLGFYSKAYQLLMLPLSRISSPLGTVAIPALSKLQDDPIRYRRSYRQALQAITLITLPGVAFMICSADWLVEIVLGVKWLPAARIFFYLGIASLVQPISHTTGWLFTTQGRGNEMVRWGAFGAFTVTVSVLAGLPFGAEGIAMAYAGMNLLVRAPTLYWYVGRNGPVRTSDIYGAAAPAASAAVLVLAVLGTLRHQVTFPGPYSGAATSLVIALACTAITLAVNPVGRVAARDSIQTLRLLRRRS